MPANHAFAGTGGPHDYFENNPAALTYLDEEGLSKLGITRSGDPAFTSWSYRDGNIVGDDPLDSLTGRYAKDFEFADVRAGFTKDNPRPKGWTWHHHERTRLILVPEGIHGTFRHFGPVAVCRGVTGDLNAYP